MNKQLVGAITGAGMLLGLTMTASPAGAAGGCPEGWRTLVAGAIVPEVDNGNFIDQNGDGTVCVRNNKGQSNKYLEEAYNVIDNVLP